MYVNSRKISHGHVQEQGFWVRAPEWNVALEGLKRFAKVSMGYQTLAGQEPAQWGLITRCIGQGSPGNNC